MANFSLDDLLNLQPSQVSRDLTGYITYIYGAPKVGKTTFARDMGALILECEAGTNALSGAYGMKMQNWSDIRTIMRLCKDAKMKERYKAIALDTVDVAAALCEKYICAMNDVDALGKVPYGGGWTAFKKEFEEVFRTITMQGYAVLFISHDKDKTITRVDGTTYNKIVPTVSESINNIVKNMADIITYCYQDPIDQERYMILRSLDGTIEAGSRFQYMESKIPLGYTSLGEALNRAIDLEEKNNGTQAVTSKKISYQPAVELDFDQLMTKFNNIVANIPGSSDGTAETKEGKEFKDFWQPKIVQLIEKYLGKGKKISQCNRDQTEQLSLIIDELEELTNIKTM